MTEQPAGMTEIGELDASQLAAKRIEEAERANGTEQKAPIERLTKPDVTFAEVWRTWAQLPSSVNTRGMWEPLGLVPTVQAVGLGRQGRDFIVAGQGIYWAVIGDTAFKGVGTWVPAEERPTMPRSEFTLEPDGYYQVWLKRRRGGRPRRQRATVATTAQ